MSISTSPSPNEKARALTGRDYLSYSALAMYQQCPLRYYFKYVEGLPEESVAAGLVFGSAIHAAIEHHFRELQLGHPPPPLAELQDAYHHAWRARDAAEVQFGQDDDPAALSVVADRMLRAFQASDLGRPTGTILAIEQELRGALAPGVPDLRARVDLLVDTGDTLIVTDFKTARSRWSPDHVDDAAEQLLLYGGLVRQMLPERPLRLEFGIVTKTKTPVVERHEVPMSAARLRRSRRILERVWRAIETGQFYPAPSPMTCPTCPFRMPCRKWGGGG